MNDEMKQLEAYARSLLKSVRDQVASEAVARMVARLDLEQAELPSKIEDAQKLDASHGMVPVVYSAFRLDGELHVGVCFQPEGTQVGECFHFDHGVGINRNEDAEVLWVKSSS
ncbi:TPA: hypothetical protein RQK91_004225 [Vibrio vulnificus]|nr:hypothetical protein [Vibrio vulnificus]